MTEFGYFALPFPGPDDDDELMRTPTFERWLGWHSEQTRAEWLPQAYDVAEENDARLMLHWQLDEVQDPLAPEDGPNDFEDFPFDTGPLSNPGSDPLRLTLRVHGARSYGKVDNSSRSWFNGLEGTEPRSAYCALRQWAIDGQYQPLALTATTDVPYPLERARCDLVQQPLVRFLRADEAVLGSCTAAIALSAGRRGVSRQAVRRLLVVALAALLVMPAAAHAQENDPNLVPVMDTFDGVVLLSEREQGDAGPASDRYYLVQEIETGVIDQPDRYPRLPIEPRVGVPFDVDLGPDEDGDLVAVYSRCDIEPVVTGVRGTFGSRVFSAPYPAYTAGRGCDIYRYDFETQQESLIDGASTRESSEVLPSIWRDQVAFVRVYEGRDGNRGVYPYLYVRPLDGGRSERQPGGSRGTEGLPGPTRLDLYGRRLSFVWNYSTRSADAGSPAGTTEVRLDTVGGSHRVLSQARHGDSGDGESFYASYLGPNGYRGRIFYGFSRVDVREGRDLGYSALRINEQLPTGARSFSDRGVDGFLVDTATDNDVTWAGVRSENLNYYESGGAYVQRIRPVDYAECLIFKRGGEECEESR